MSRQSGKLGPFDYYEGITESLEVFSWCPTPEPVGTPTQVHLLIPFNEGKIRIRFKSAHSYDQLIAALVARRVEVWGEPTDADREKAESLLEHRVPNQDPVTDFEGLFEFFQSVPPSHHPLLADEDDLVEVIATLSGQLGLTNPAARIQFAGQCAGIAMRLERVDSKLTLMRIIHAILRDETKALGEIIGEKLPGVQEALSAELPVVDK